VWAIRNGLEVLDEYVIKVRAVKIMACNEGWSRRRHEDIKMTAVERSGKWCRKISEGGTGVVGGRAAWVGTAWALVPE